MAYSSAGTVKKGDRERRMGEKKSRPPLSKEKRGGERKEKGKSN